MRQATKERAKRLVIAAILNSDLSDSDILQVANAFMMDFDFYQSIGHALQMIVPKESSSSNDSRGGWANKASRIIKSKKIPKSDIINWLRPHLPAEVLSTTRTFMHILRNAERDLPDITREQFMRWIEAGQSREDEYLKGIMKER